MGLVHSRQPLPEAPGTLAAAPMLAVADSLVVQTGQLAASEVADDASQTVEVKIESPVSEQSCLRAADRSLTASEQCAGSAGLTAALGRAGFIS